jgi:hypothetical protein
MRVQHFATYLGDLLFPDAVADTESLLQGAGCEVVFPHGKSAMLRKSRLRMPSGSMTKALR